MEETRSLDTLKTGERAVVAKVDGPERRRLQELGFVPGGRVAAVQESPWGDPVAYSVCGAVIALRRCDARQIQIAEET